MNAFLKELGVYILHWFRLPLLVALLYGSIAGVPSLLYGAGTFSRVSYDVYFYNENVSFEVPEQYFVTTFTIIAVLVVLALFTAHFVSWLDRRTTD